MDTKIISYRLPGTTPSSQVDCGWIAVVDDIEVGWVSMIFHPDKTIKLADAYVIPEYRGKGIYNKLWHHRYNYCVDNYPDHRLIAYCKESVLDYFLNKGFEEKETVTLVELNAR